MLMTSKIVYNMVTRSCLQTTQANELSINVSKTKCMLFRSTKSKTPPSGQPISLRKFDIEQVCSLKFLGVHIDEHLTWSVHAKHVLNKLRSGLAAVRRVKPFFESRNTNHLISFIITL